MSDVVGDRARQAGVTEARYRRLRDAAQRLVNQLHSENSSVEQDETAIRALTAALRAQQGEGET